MWPFSKRTPRSEGVSTPSCGSGQKLQDQSLMVEQFMCHVSDTFMVCVCMCVCAGLSVGVNRVTQLVGRGKKKTPFKSEQVRTGTGIGD